jgi:hypothetical protein
LDPENIIVIDQKQYIYLSNDLFTINKNETITIYKPFVKSIYNSPELNNINTLPLTIHFKTIYYSLAIVIQEIVNGKKNYLQNTKLNFALKRCLKPKPEERVILFI